MDENLARIRHERSKKDFPGVHLEEDEYVEFAFRRAKICLWLILGGLALSLILILLAFLLVLMGQSMIDDTGKHFLFIILTTLLVSAFIIATFSLKVYRGNRLIVTNKHVIQYIMDSIVSSSVNTIDLGSIEDASFRQNGIMQKIFGYGTLRLATVGDETTYTFKYSDIAPVDLRTITELITNAKKITKQPQKKKTSDSNSAA